MTASVCVKLKSVNKRIKPKAQGIAITNRYGLIFSFDLNLTLPANTPIIGSFVTSHIVPNVIIVPAVRTGI